MRAGLYARVSREEQAEGYSIDEQLAAMRRFCQDRGWTVAAEYVEPGLSGTTHDRPALQDALDASKAGEITVLLTHQLDRFYRNLQLQLETLGALGEWGVGYLSVVEQIDYSTPQGKLFLFMLGAFNEYYVANLRRETRKGKKGRARKGLSNASLPAYGYVRKEGSDVDVIDPEAAKAVRLAFESYASGDYSFVTIADLLNQEGFVPEGRSRSGRWTRETARYMLRNPHYLGQVRYGDELYPGQHEAIIDQELWDQVQAIRTSRGHGKGAGRKAHRVYLLARLARCHVCGLRLTAQSSEYAPGRRSAYYLCPSVRRGMDCITHNAMVPADAIDEQVSDLVSQLRLPDDWRDRLAELDENKEERSRIEGKRLYLQRKLSRLRDLYLEDEFTRQEYHHRKVELEAQLNELHIPEAPDVQKAGETLESIGTEWFNAPKSYKRDMLRILFENVFVNVLNRRLVGVQPYPPFVPLFEMNGKDQDDDRIHQCQEPDTEAGPES